MEKLPTAEEFFADLPRYDHQEHVYCPAAEDRAIQFAKLHVEAALKAAAEDVCINWDAIDLLYGDSEKVINKESILAAYPLDNIK